MNEMLTPPETVHKIEKESASNMVKLSEDDVSTLNLQVTEFIQDITLNTLESDEFKNNVSRIHSMGSEEIRDAANISSRMLERPVSTMESGVFDGASPVSQALLNLRSTVEKLDPSKQGDLFSTKKILGLIPFGNKLKDYFRLYQSSQSNINAIITALNNGKDELLKDNATIEEEKLNLWDVMQSLEKYIYLGKKIDENLLKGLTALEINDPEKVKKIKEEILFYVRQKNQDMLTQLAVSVQGYMAMDMIKKNNLELIKGVDRATNTTVSALKTAVTVAQALANEKLVLDQINALNETTGSIIEGTSNALKQQAAEIHNQSINTTIEIDKIQNAFKNIYETMDMIDTYKVEALERMGETVNILTTEIEKAKVYVDKPEEKHQKETIKISDEG